MTEHLLLIFGTKKLKKGQSQCSSSLLFISRIISQKQRWSRIKYLDKTALKNPFIFPTSVEDSMFVKGKQDLSAVFCTNCLNF